MDGGFPEHIYGGLGSSMFFSRVDDDEVASSSNASDEALNYDDLPQFIVTAEGDSLDLSMTDLTSVISHPFHGGLNQQWLIELCDDGDGQVTIMSRYNQTYVGIKKRALDEPLVSTRVPFYWEVSKDGPGYKFIVPNTRLSLSLGACARLRRIYEDHGTRLYRFENSEANRAMIKRGEIATPIDNRGSNVDRDLTSPNNAAATLKVLESFLTSEGVKNLLKALDHRPSSESTTSTASTSSRILNKSRTKKAVIGQTNPVPTTCPGVADIVAFGAAGVTVVRNTAHPQKRLAIADFGSDSGWLTERHVRLLADTTGNGRADIVGFGDKGGWVALNNGDNTFQPRKQITSSFTYAAGWRVEKHLRFMADIRNTGRTDIVGFGDPGVLVSQNNGDGTFGPSRIVLNDFGYDDGWRLDKHLRFLADMDGNGLLDIVGFGEEYVWVARNNGNGTFRAPEAILSDLCYSKGWRVDRHPRFIADLTGNGKLDLIGFGDEGVSVALNTGDGTFDPARRVLRGFHYQMGWRVENHPRFVADLTGNGCADIIGVGKTGVFVSLNNGDGTFGPSTMAASHLCFDSGWKVDERNPRVLADMTGDGRPDLVGFGSHGVYVAYNDGKGKFERKEQLIAGFGSEEPEWAAGKGIKYVANLSSS